MCGSYEAKWKCLPWNLPTSKDWRLARRDWKVHSVHENWSKFRVWAGEASRKLSTPNHVSDCLWKTLFSPAPLWFKISTRKIPKENAKRAGRFGRGDMHHIWHPCAWKDAKKYDERLEAVLTRLIRARITLNQGKCKFLRKQLKFAGNGFSAQGMGPDPDKTAPFEKMESPQNAAELWKFLGKINHQHKFIKNLSEETIPLRGLL